MNIEKTMIEKLRITEAGSLDPIDVFIDKISDTSGKLTVNCYGESWTAFWSNVGERGIVEYLKSAENEGIIEYLDGEINRHTKDWDAYKELLKSHCKELDSEHQESIIDAIDEMDEERLESQLRMDHEDNFDCREILMDCGELQYSTDVLPDDIVIGNLFRSANRIPKKEHHRYVYLSKIVDAVKEAL